MPVTLIGSKWSSGTLIFFTKSTGTAVLTLTTTGVTITPALTCASTLACASADLGTTCEANAYTVGGVAGVSKGAGAVTSLTCVNGIITAIS